MHPLDVLMLTCTSCGGLTPPEASTTCLHCDAPLRRPVSRVLRPAWALRMTALLGPAGAILLAACYGAPGRYLRDPNARNDGVTRVDQDGDGVYGPWVCIDDSARCSPGYLPSLPPPPDVDCNDNDPTIYPGAPDPDGDGVDQNCDAVDGWRDPSRTYATPPGSPPATIATPPNE